MTEIKDQVFRVLLIEDNAVDSCFIEQILSEQSAPSFEIDTVQSVETALARLGQEIPDAILLDLTLPDSYGLDTFESIHQRVPYVPIILITGKDDDNLALEAVLKGAQDYLMKDHVHGKMLARVLLYAIERKRSEEALREIAQGVSSATGEAFFRALVQHLNKALHVDYAYIAEFVEYDDRMMRTISYYAHERILENIEFELAPTPYTEFKENKVVHFEKGVREQFPLDPLLSEASAESYMGIALYDDDKKPIGLLVVMARQEIKNPTLAKSMMQIFAPRVSGELERRRAEAVLAKAREQEIAIGFRIQQDLLLGKPPRDIDGVSVAAHTTPSQEVDGDFYDFFKHNDKCFDVIIGDFMGKGIPAALLGAATKSQFLRAIGLLGAKDDKNKLDSSTADIVSLVHKQMAHQLIALESFVTICYARFDLENQRINFVDCGHTETIHYKAKTGTFERIRGENMPLGFTEDETYKEVSVPFEKGDTFFFYSDGVTQAINENGEMYGEDRLGKLIAGNSELDPQELINLVCDEVLEFSDGHNYDDDLTCVVVHVGESCSREAKDSASVEIPSELTQLDEVRNLIRSFCEKNASGLVNAEDVDRLELAANEAVANIIEHAYAGASDKKVRIEASLFDDQISIHLYHSGNAFDPSKVRPPDFDGSREGGFGVFIIEQCVDKVRYFSDPKHGQCIHLITKLNKETNKGDEHGSDN